MYLDKLTLEEYLKAITNKNIELPAFLNKIAMEQVMFHWCETPQGEAKPDGTIALPIFGFSSILNIFGHKTFGEILVDSSSESKGKIIAAPINISNGLLKISGKGKGTPEKYKGSTKVDPGGMELLFNSKGPDYFSFSAKIDILGLSTESSGKLSDNGITVNVKSNIVNIFKDELEVTLNDTNFEAKAGLDVGFKNKSITLPMNLGKLDFSTSVKGSFVAIYNKGVLKTKINAKFEIIGLDFNLGTIQLDTRDIKDIPNLLFKYIEENVEKIFADLLKDAELWLKAIKAKIIQIVDQLIGKALHDVYGIARDKIAPLVKTLLDFKPEQIAGVLKGAGENAANVIKALSDLGYSDKIIEGAIKTIFPDAKVNISLGHTDIPASMHIDKGAKGHIDEGARGHIDKGAKAHIDTRTGFHTDIGGSAHVDKSARLHVNESARAHVNTPLVPHIDTKNHIDI
ncbi:MAG: hypothetical protein IPP64_11790 [Bacteroidetes bacterium]|nr:hypothetical protein [Bacteroidota bacterium]